MEDIRYQKEVDTSEPWSIREALLENGWVQTSLYAGDFRFHTHSLQSVGIERKTVTDLVSSMNNRLAEQLSKLIETYNIRILLIEGRWKRVGEQIITSRGVEPQWKWSTIWNMLRSWQDRGVTLELTASESHTTRRLNELYAYYQKPYHTGGITRQFAGDSRLLALQCQGVGPKTAQAVLDYFGSLKAIAFAEVDELMAVDGVGKSLAQAIWNHFNRI